MIEDMIIVNLADVPAVTAIQEQQSELIDEAYWHGQEVIRLKKIIVPIEKVMSKMYLKYSRSIGKGASHVSKKMVRLLAAIIIKNRFIENWYETMKEHASAAIWCSQEIDRLEKQIEEIVALAYSTGKVPDRTSMN